jgi:hypothetical protein
MRLHILSDLHREFEPFTPRAVETNAVILAGDISTGRNGLKWALKSFPERPVVYVLGFHSLTLRHSNVAELFPALMSTC